MFHISYQFRNGTLSVTHQRMSETYFTQPTDDVGNEERAPAEKEHPHDHPDRDGGLVLVH